MAWSGHDRHKRISEAHGPLTASVEQKGDEASPPSLSVKRRSETFSPSGSARKESGHHFPLPYNCALRTCLPTYDLGSIFGGSDRRMAS